MSAENKVIPERSPIRQVRISTGCRLHFGLLSVGRSTGRQFGGAGVMLESPGWEIAMSPARQDLIVAPHEVQIRIAETLRRLRETAPHPAQFDGVHVEVIRQIPRHAGLGSGTQLGLALAQGWNRLQGHVPLSSVELARRAGRGLRSAIGVHGFDQGGFIVEAGKLGDEISPLVNHEEFPPEWRFVLIQPKEVSGLCGQAELRGFSRLDPMPESTTARLWQLLESELIPALRSQDFHTCAASLYEFGRIVGEYFAPVQGGIYASPQMVQLAARLRQEGFNGIGQTSWGPTLFVLCPNQAAVVTLTERLSSLPESSNCHVMIVIPRNRGADFTSK